MLYIHTVRCSVLGVMCMIVRIQHDAVAWAGRLEAGCCWHTVSLLSCRRRHSAHSKLAKQLIHSKPIATRQVVDLFTRSLPNAHRHYRYCTTEAHNTPSSSRHSACTCHGPTATTVKCVAEAPCDRLLPAAAHTHQLLSRLTSCVSARPPCA